MFFCAPIRAVLAPFATRNWYITGTGFVWPRVWLTAMRSVLDQLEIVKVGSKPVSAATGLGMGVLASSTIARKLLFQL